MESLFGLAIDRISKCPAALIATFLTVGVAFSCMAIAMFRGVVLPDGITPIVVIASGCLGLGLGTLFKPQINSVRTWLGEKHMLRAIRRCEKAGSFTPAQAEIARKYVIGNLWADPDFLHRMFEEQPHASPQPHGRISGATATDQPANHPEVTTQPSRTDSS